jgi:hypothetical protein
MTEQSTRGPWTPPAGTPHQTGPDWTDAQHPAENGTISQTAAHESADGVPAADEQRAGVSAVNEPGAQEPADEHAGEESAADDDSLDAVDVSVPADHPNRDPDYPGQPTAATSAPDAEPATDPQVGIAGRGLVHSADVAAPADVPNERNGAQRYLPDAATAMQEPAEDHDHVAGMTDTGQTVDDVEERAAITGDEAPRAAAPSDQPAALDVTSSGELLPSDGPQEPMLALLDGETTNRFRDRWQKLQLRFIDDPNTAAGQAGALVDDVVTALHEAVDQQRLALEDWRSGDRVDAHAGDTERLRVAVRRYRDFLDHLLGQ